MWHQEWTIVCVYPKQMLPINQHYMTVISVNNILALDWMRQFIKQNTIYYYLQTMQCKFTNFQYGEVS